MRRVIESRGKTWLPRAAITGVVKMNGNPKQTIINSTATSKELVISFQGFAFASCEAGFLVRNERGSRRERITGLLRTRM
jgi:hypothetical protein